MVPTIKIHTTTIVMVSTLISVKIQSTILIIMTNIMTETKIIREIIMEIINKENPNVKKDRTIYQ
jgi:glycine betaine/choline ABC-type transport system substrate-binding protein